jgi:hypothetical protein
LLDPKNEGLPKVDRLVLDRRYRFECRMGRVQKFLTSGKEIALGAKTFSGLVFLVGRQCFLTPSQLMASRTAAV